MPRKTLRYWLLLLFAFACLPSLYADEAPETKLKGLLIAGGCCHDYPRQNKIITEGLSQRVSISWDVVLGPNGRDAKLDVYKKEDWIKDYDIVVHNECYGGVTDVEFVDSIVQAHVDSGVPAIVVHCSMHSYRNAKTDQWRKLLGVTSKRHEKGGRRLDVKNEAQDHPIMQGFPRMWRTPNGELYVVEKTWDTARPLATAFGQDTKKDQMCVWTNEYEGVRTFGTTLGHHNETMMAREWLDLTARGLLWCTGHLNEDGTPAKGYEGAGVGPFSFQIEDPTKQPTPVEQ